MKASPKSSPKGKDLKNAQRPPWFVLQDMGKKIDVNAFAMERFNKNTGSMSPIKIFKNQGYSFVFAQKNAARRISGQDKIIKGG